MRCPFLREEQVRSCQASPFRKQIARRATDREEERCSSPDYRTCPNAPQHHETRPELSRCPFLQESLVQFCAADAVARYVPWSEASLSCCGHDGHRFCELFLAFAGGVTPGPAKRDAPDDETAARISTVDGLPVPGWLFYAPNHMWLDSGDDGLCHLGIDAFLARVMGRVDRLVFLTAKGLVRPTVVLTARGVDLTLTFPHSVVITATNNRLRSTLGRLTSDPYGSGWLFEGRLETSPGEVPVEAGPLCAPSSQESSDWMTREGRRLTEFVHEQILGRRGAGEILVADGGAPVPDLLQHLDHEEIVRLFRSFFPLPSTSQRMP